MMLQEAGEFANHLKKIEKDIRGLKTATECEPAAQAPPRSAAGCAGRRRCFQRPAVGRSAPWRHGLSAIPSQPHCFCI
jgi:hypothetical protein